MGPRKDLHIVWTWHLAVEGGMALLSVDAYPSEALAL